MRLSRDLVVDLGIASAFAGAMLVELDLSPDARGGPLSIAAIVASVLPVLWWRTRPFASLVAAMVLLYGVLSTANIYQVAPAPSMLAGFAVAVTASRRTTVLVGLALVPFVLLAIGVYGGEKILGWETPKNLAFIALPIILGSAVRDRRAYTRALVDRAETAERTREEEALRRVGEERLRIARDVHDVVAHAMVAINVQAGVGAHLLDRDTEQARTRLLDIKRVSGEALTDLRATLGMLRAESGAADDTAPISPTQTLHELPDLAAGLRAAGVQVDLVIADARGLPATIDATGYRIVQEALTNVLRHAGSPVARVHVRREGGHVVIEVDDDGPAPYDDVAAAGRAAAGPGTPGSGNGVRGMRERARAVGGVLEAGPRDDGGWRVRARLPLAVGA